LEVHGWKVIGVAAVAGEEEVVGEMGEQTLRHHFERSRLTRFSLQFDTPTGGLNYR
jgi:hypothetical protein